MTKKLPPLETPTMVMAIMKCCNRATHTSKCARYWHQRQRDEVRKRVAGEKLFNQQLLAAENKTAEAWERAEAIAAETINHAHELAFAMSERKMDAGDAVPALSKDTWPS